MKTVRTECLDHFVIFGERHLRHLLKEFMGHYLTERYHHGLGSQDHSTECPAKQRQRGARPNRTPIHASADCSTTIAGLPPNIRRRDSGHHEFSDRTGSGPSPVSAGAPIAPCLDGLRGRMVC